MTATEVFEMVSEGGSTDFAQAMDVCRRNGPFCLIGGLAVNCYVAPVYTMDADIVLAAASLSPTTLALGEVGFEIKDFEHSTNAVMSGSQLVIQFTKDPRYQAFLGRAKMMEVLGCEVPVASLHDLTHGKVWAWSDPERRLSKRKKDELDLIRLGEKFPEIHEILPLEIRRQLEEAP